MLIIEFSGREKKNFSLSIIIVEWVYFFGLTPPLFHSSFVFLNCYSIVSCKVLVWFHLFSIHYTRPTTLHDKLSEFFSPAILFWAFPFLRQKSIFFLTTYSNCSTDMHMNKCIHIEKHIALAVNRIKIYEHNRFNISCVVAWLFEILSRLQNTICCVPLFRLPILARNTKQIQNGTSQLSRQQLIINKVSVRGRCSAFFSIDNCLNFLHVDDRRNKAFTSFDLSDLDTKNLVWRKWKKNWMKIKAGCLNWRQRRSDTHTHTNYCVVRLSSNTLEQPV